MQRSNGAFTLWFTGLPCSGKTTLARGMKRLLASRGLPSDVIDGDAMRGGWCRDLGYSRKDRDTNIRRAAVLARLLNEAGIISLVALVSPYRKSRLRARKIVGKKKFIEVYLKCPERVRRKRDARGVYQLGRSGLYEPPQRADVVLATSKISSLECLKVLWQVLERQNFILFPMDCTHSRSTFRSFSDSSLLQKGL